jgi:hypothetical protein
MVSTAMENDANSARVLVNIFKDEVLGLDPEGNPKLFELPDQNRNI